jgi:hypothetical protein
MDNLLKIIHKIIKKQILYKGNIQHFFRIIHKIKYQRVKVNRV